jgi:hypothetical protein
MPKVQHLDTPLATIGVHTLPAANEPVGTMALPVRDHLNSATVTSLLGTDWSFLGNRSVDRTILQGSVLTLQRNEAVQRMNGDWLLFVDDDMTWRPEAFCIIGRDVFEAMMGGPMPSKADRALLPPWEFFYWRGAMGEDLRFCIDARAAGARIFVDTRVTTGHIGEKEFGIEDFWSQVAMRGPVIDSLRRESNDRMGLPTLTGDEARKRLGW